MYKEQLGMNKMSIDKAIKFAREAHEGQVRKGSAEPYVNHPIAVMEILRKHHPEATLEMKIAAVLHDVVEDTNRTQNDICINFGETVMHLVLWLTNPSNPKIATRNEKVEGKIRQISNSPVEAQIIKCADIIHNSFSSTENLGIDFAKIYRRESELKLLGMNSEVKTLNIWKVAASIIINVNK
jgi:(p)ppGpp synthase/HD superfamily hydrolase